MVQHHSLYIAILRSLTTVHLATVAQIDEGRCLAIGRALLWRLRVAQRKT
jgi:hypothetical protein